MASLNRTMILNTLIKHETLIIGDLEKMVNPGIVPMKNHLQLLLDELLQSGHIHMLNGVEPHTYTITVKGIREGERLAQEIQEPDSRQPLQSKKNR